MYKFILPYLKNISVLLFFCCIACDTSKKQTPDYAINNEESAKEQQQEPEEKLIDPNGNTIETRFKTPKGFTRTSETATSFGTYLRNLPLKAMDSPVLYFNGETKRNANVYISVVDMEIGTRDLQQCADAVMRLRGEYLYHQKKYDAIHFNFLSDGKPRYFTNYAKGDLSYKKFRKYMNYIFAYANTASLLNELQPVSNITDMKIGDVFIQKGNPFGHAVIVVDVAKNVEGKTIYMLAQSYMPAQETQILINRNNNKMSPWYEAKAGTVYTPEWTFESSDLRRFK